MQYKLLGKTGLRVSDICLGTMTFGEEWGWGAGHDESLAQFHAYLDAGGNFIDTANRYTEGTSEKMLGEFIKNSGQRNNLVVATKYSLITDRSAGINQSGNHKKNLLQSVEDSLRRLQTDRIDILYLHAWDFTTYMEEIMRAMDDLVRQGKILYTGICNTPAWIVSRANAIAEFKDWSPFVALQIEYSLMQRSVERELIPMADALDMAILAWAPIAGGALTGKYLEKNDQPKRLKENSKRLSPHNMEIASVVVQIAEQKNCSPAQVAIAWVMQQNARVIPIVGARNTQQLADNLHSSEVHLNADEMQQLDAISKVDMEYPYAFLQGEGVQDILFASKGGMLQKDRKSF
ncbi:MAG: aldo/keto reductase [Chitinophagales bacterium]